jgi:hypothetical protein
MSGVAWEETIEKLRRAGFNKEEIDERRKDPVAGIRNFLEEERGRPLCLEGKGLSYEITGKKTSGSILK